jgi:hypothetical protein
MNACPTSTPFPACSALYDRGRTQARPGGRPARDIDASDGGTAAMSVTDKRTVASNTGIPLHAGAARYYREVGYLR